MKFNKNLYNTANLGDRVPHKNEYHEFHEEDKYVTHNFGLDITNKYKNIANAWSPGSVIKSNN